MATFAAVLIAGVALAFMSAPGSEVADGAEEEAVKETTTTSVFHEEEKELPQESEYVEEAPKDEKAPYEEEPKAEEEPEVDDTPPELVILYPEDGAHFTEKTLAFEGEVEPGAQVFAGDYQADVTDDGHWTIVLLLSDGGNLATITAVDEAGNESHAQVKVYLDSAHDEGKEEPKDYVLTANQKYGSCGEDVPYDVWYGTGEPGTTVTIGSEYGSGSTVIGEKGNWDLKVFFPEAPCNKQFAVVLETNDGHHKVYEFIRICEESGGDSTEKEPK